MAANHDLTRQAIEVMTAWLDNPNDTGFAAKRIAALLEGTPDAGPDGQIDAAIDLITGMINLSGLLLLRIEQASGDKGPTTLQKMARLTTLDD